MREFHIKSLDGIRAISVLLVFFSHMDLWHIFPGFFGVNVFFLLSGFLITTLMIREHASRGRVNIKEFYIRRALRILPPMYIVLAIGVVHHLDDAEAVKLFQLAHAALKSGGRLVTMDGCYVPKQSRVARHLLARHCRNGVASGRAPPAPVRRA